MDKTEAREVARARAEELRGMTWSALRERYLDRSDTAEIVGRSGTTYQVETWALWDSALDGDLRMFVAVDDGGWRAFAPLSESFIISPDGSFVGE